MVAAISQFKPDYAVAPGSVLKERLGVQGLSQAEFSRRCGCSAKLIGELLRAKQELNRKLHFSSRRCLALTLAFGLESIQVFKFTKHQRLRKRTRLPIWSEQEPSQFGN